VKTPLKIIAVVCLLAAVALAAGLGYWYGYGGRAVGLAESEDVADRLEAVEILRGRDSGLAERVFRKLSDDPELRVALAAVRAAGESEGCRALLIERCKGGRKEVRAVAAAELGRFQDTDSRMLIGLLTDDSAAVRVGAAEGLARKRDPAALDALVAAMSDADVGVRRQAYTALCRTLGLRFTYRADAPSDQRARAIAVVKDYLAKRAAGTLHGAEDH